MREIEHTRDGSDCDELYGGMSRVEVSRFEERSGELELG